MKNGFIYLIESVNFSKLYLGSTEDPNRRIKQHNSGTCETTGRFYPWRFLLIINVGTIDEARIIEKYIKSFKEKLEIKNIIKALSQYYKNSSARSGTPE